MGIGRVGKIQVNAVRLFVTNQEFNYNQELVQTLPHNLEVGFVVGYHNEALIVSPLVHTNQKNVNQEN